jgi:hypothetical protein
VPIMCVGHAAPLDRRTPGHQPGAPALQIALLMIGP